MKSCTYGEFSEVLHRHIGGRRLPLDGTVEITHRCNLQCVHCYNRIPIEDSGVRSKELSYSEHCRILDEAAEAGCLWLLFTGGEIFVRPDFLDIYTYAKQKGFLITLFTNGTLITPQAADHLARYKPFSIEITLYGRTQKTYERITRVPGSFEKCLRGIRLLKERNLPLTIKTVAVTLNKHEIWDLKKFVERDLGLEFRFDAMINPGINGSRRPLSYRLTPEEVVELDLLDPARMEAWKSLARRFNGPVHPPAATDELYHCGGGIHSFSINPEGQMTLCSLSQNDGYDLRTGSFRDAWERHLFGVRHRKITTTTKCVSCQIKAMCGMCPANGELEEKDPESPVDFLCRVAHLRCYVLNIPVPAHGECEYCEGGSAYQEIKAQAAHLRNKIINTGSMPEGFNALRSAVL